MATVNLHHVNVRALLAALPTPPRSGIQTRILDALETACGRLVSADDLVDVVYGEDPDGGPLTALAGLGVHITRLRARGYPIRNEHGRGYRLPVQL